MMKKRVFLQIEGMHCADCPQHLKEVLGKIDGVEELQIPDWRSKRATLVLSKELNIEIILKAMEKHGYHGTVVSQQEIETKNATAEKDYDLLIIGGGSAAFAAAIKASELGAKVGIVESHTIGGTCVNVGCVPSKFLIRAAEIYHWAAHPRFDGLKSNAVSLNWPELINQKERLVSSLRQAKYIHLLDVYPQISMLQGEAKFAEANRLIVGDKSYSSRKIIIATGSSPSVPPIPGLKEVGYLDSSSALSLKALPSTLAVIGGGAIGLELGQMFSRFGVKVVLLEALPSIVMSEEPEIRDSLKRYLEEEGIQIYTHTQILNVEKTTNKRNRIYIQKEDKVIPVEVDQILVATGRVPNTSGLGLEKAAVKVGNRREVVVDASLRTTNPDIYAAGDCAGFPQFVYVSAYTGGIAAENALSGKSRVVDLTSLPRVTFTDPQIASVGLTEEAAKKAGLCTMVAVLPIKEVPKAIISLDTRGLVKLVAEENTGRLLGAHILASAAGDFIQEAVLALRHGLTLYDIIEAFHPYLTMAEALKLAALTFKKDVGQLSCCAT
ncbi:mercury(II) reductase [Methylacidiphilum caldifontis]|uniref:mercury(II) reductase n=1 Tax=Methylacidiphilum caldifontis TaxID=2795386 RepID=UPI001F5D4138|nr:mercury(II) reductase [Methylacidiphilum caldifontis]